ncbi:nucleolar complex protein 2 homolog [Phragmites australis]|uniref:nucleolar complex protein 2 homolog n=1 Tax=Phragmites australis TaxID=29695 RepID=UPI002D770309|nr:nucleolar complex protein 2 homolog [Phragmites australis]
MSDSDDYVDLPVSDGDDDGEEWDEDDEEEMEEDEEGRGGSSRKKSKQHVEQLKRLQEKDPEFYKYLEKCDKELLEFTDDEIEDDQDTGVADDEEPRSVPKEQLKQIVKPITLEMVDSWCNGVENGKIGSIRSILQAFRKACHYGEDQGDNSAPKFSVMSGSVLDKVMHFVLKHMDRVLRQLLSAPSFGGKKETISELMITKSWKRHGDLMRIYLANALHMITEMTDEQMIAFTIHRVRASAVFLAAFPSLLRKYVKALLHTWARGRGAMPLVSFMFLRDLCIQLGSDCLDTCLKGIYKAYLVNCKLSKSISGSKLQHIHFLGNCVRELYSLDPQSAYQHAFVFIRQLAVILRGALTERGPKSAKDKRQKESSKSTKKLMEKSYQRVYDWQYIFCLELWTSVVCGCSSEEEFRPLAYPLTQIIHGVACLVPSARYFPVRLRCVKMLNCIAEATGTFIPVSSLLLDMLEMKELRGRPDGGVGKAVNLFSVKQVDKKTVKTRAFQEACIYSVVDELAKHLAQWSFSIAFFEMSFIPLVRLRSFCKTIKADRFRKEMKDLIRQIEANVEFIKSKRVGIAFSPNDPAVESFMQTEKEERSSPLSKYVATLHQREQDRMDALDETSVIVGAESSTFSRRLSEVQKQQDEQDDNEGTIAFSKNWLAEKRKPKTVKENKKRAREHDDVATEEDLVEDLVLSSDEEVEEGGNNQESDEDGSVPVEDDSDEDFIDPDSEYKKQKKAKSKKRNKRQSSNKAPSNTKTKPRPKKKAKH